MISILLLSLKKMVTDCGDIVDEEVEMIEEGLTITIAMTISKGDDDGDDIAAYAADDDDGKCW